MELEQRGECSALPLPTLCSCSGSLGLALPAVVAGESVACTLSIMSTDAACPHIHSCHHPPSQPMLLMAQPSTFSAFALIDAFNPSGLSCVFGLLRTVLVLVGMQSLGI